MSMQHHKLLSASALSAKRVPRSAHRPSTSALTEAASSGHLLKSRLAKLWKSCMWVRAMPRVNLVHPFSLPDTVSFFPSLIKKSKFKSVIPLLKPTYGYLSRRKGNSKSSWLCPNPDIWSAFCSFFFCSNLTLPYHPALVFSGPPSPAPGYSRKQQAQCASGSLLLLLFIPRVLFPLTFPKSAPSLQRRACSVVTLPEGPPHPFHLDGPTPHLLTI